MSNDTTYNGWTNYPTWVVNLWLGETFYELSQEYISDNHEDEIHPSVIGDYLKEWYEECYPTDESGPNVDIMTWAVGQINWTEIAEHAIEE